MGPRVQPITGLVFAIDFRHNGKDAWWRTSGSLVGSLTGVAAVSGGGLVVGATGDSLNFALTAAAQTPRTAGAVLIDQTFAGANDGVLDDFLFDFMPNGTPGATSNVNRIFIVRTETGADGNLLGRVYTSSGTSVTSPTTIEANTSARRNVVLSWNGFTGAAGAANLYMSVDGGTPVSTLAQTSTRNDDGTSGTLAIANGSEGGTGTQNRNMEGTAWRFAVFNVTNPAGQDLTAAGWSAAAIWDAIFPQMAGSRHNGYGEGASGNAVRRFF